MTGRKSEFDWDVVRPIMERMVEGETLSAICRSLGNKPSPGTVNRWAVEDARFGLEFLRARQLQMLAWADEIVAIADDDTLDTVEKTTPQGRTFIGVDHENIQRSRLKVETRKFLMSKIAPHLFGDKVLHEHSGTVTQRHEMSDRERARRMAFFLSKGERPPLPVPKGSDPIQNNDLPDDDVPSHVTEAMSTG